MGRHGNGTQFALVIALSGVFAFGPVLGGTTGSLAQDAPTQPTNLATPTAQASPSAPNSQPASAPGATTGTPGRGSTDIAQFTAGILASMNGGPRIWQSPDAVIPDFNAVNDAIAKATDADLRVAIWGAADAGVNAEDVATSLGQNLGGTIIAISPSSVGVYSANLPDKAVDQAMAGVASQLAGEQDPAVIITKVTEALAGGMATSSIGLMVPALVGLAILIVGGGAWFLLGRDRQRADQTSPRDTNASWGVRLNRLLVGRKADTGDDEADEVDVDALDDDYVVDQPVRRIAAEVIDIESDVPRPEEISRSAVGVQTTASSYGKVAARTQLDQIAQRIVVLSNQVVRTQDVSLMNAFEQVAAAYTDAKADLEHADRPVDVINLNDRLRSLSDQIAVLERRIEP